jgi:pyrimidine deaminase RibD-like protein
LQAFNLVTLLTSKFVTIEPCHHACLQVMTETSKQVSLQAMNDPNKHASLKAINETSNEHPMQTSKQTCPGESLFA